MWGHFHRDCPNKKSKLYYQYFLSSTQLHTVSCVKLIGPLQSYYALQSNMHLKSASTIAIISSTWVSSIIIFRVIIWPWFLALPVQAILQDHLDVPSRTACCCWLTWSSCLVLWTSNIALHYTSKMHRAIKNIFSKH